MLRIAACFRATKCYVQSYSVPGLFERLREDAARYPDTMDQRYGAWPQLRTFFRLIYDGGGHGAMHLPARHGKLFDPDAEPEWIRSSDGGYPSIALPRRNLPVKDARG